MKKSLLYLSLLGLLSLSVPSMALADDGGYESFASSSGLTYGFSFGWFGQFFEGKNEENGFSFGGNVGYKGPYVGFSLDMDISVSPTDRKFEDIWTYSISGLLVGYIPISDSFMPTIGFGVGYTGWTLDYEYTSYGLGYDWYNGYYVTEDNYDRVLDSGGFMSLKLRCGLNFTFDDFLFGLEVDWIPWLDLDNGAKIANNIIGVQLSFGGISIF